MRTTFEREARERCDASLGNDGRFGENCPTPWEEAERLAASDDDDDQSTTDVLHREPSNQQTPGRILGAALWHLETAIFPGLLVIGGPQNN